MEKEITPVDTIPISMEEYNRLLSRDEFLTCLESAGVDNWNGYEYAMEEFEKSQG